MSTNPNQTDLNTAGATPETTARHRTQSMSGADNTLIKETFGDLASQIGMQGHFTHLYEARKEELSLSGLASDELAKQLGTLEKDYTEGKKQFTEQIAKAKTAFQEALEDSGKSPESAKSMAEQAHKLLNDSIGDPNKNTSFSEAFDNVVGAIEGLDLTLDDDERAALDEQYEKAQKDRQRVRQMTEELKMHAEHGTPIFRSFGLGMKLPTKKLSEADMMGAANVFLAKARAEGHIKLSDAELTEQQAILGVVSTVMAQQHSIRSVVNMGITGLAEGSPLVAAGLFEAGKGIVKADWEKALKKADGTDLKKDLGNTFEEFTASMKSAGQHVDYKVTAAERMRITRELWHVMQDPDGAVMIHGVALKQKHIDMLKEKGIELQGDPPTLHELASKLDPQMAKLATMWTGAFAKADAQANTRAYDMNYHYTEDGKGMNAWTAMGGQPAASMMKYAIPKNGTTPSVDYYTDKKNAGEREPERDGNLRRDRNETRHAQRDPQNPLQQALGGVKLNLKGNFGPVDAKIEMTENGANVTARAKGLGKAELDFPEHG